MAKIELKTDENKIKTILDFYILTNKLKDLLRAGWQSWGLTKKRAESVAEHIYGTCMLAVAIWSETLPNINLSEVILMLALHETEEIIIKDITPFDSPDKQKVKKAGQKASEMVFKDLIAKDVYNKLISDFNNRSTPEAVFAHKCDKLECDLQARIYSDEGYLKYEKAGDIKNNPFILKCREKGIKDVADYFAINDKQHYSDVDDIFAKINKHITGRKIVTKKDKHE